MKNITYKEGDHRLLNVVAPLWNKLKQYHLRNSIHFSTESRNYTFSERKKDLMTRTYNGKIKIILAQVNNKNIGYCISSTRLKLGQIESIFIEKKYRSKGIGTELMTRSLAWLKEEKADPVILGTAFGNQKILSFYQKFNFYPRTVICQHKPGSRWTTKR